MAANVRVEAGTDVAVADFVIESGSAVMTRETGANSAMSGDTDDLLSSTAVIYATWLPHSTCSRSAARY